MDLSAVLRPCNTGVDWQGLSALLSANAGLIAFLTLMTFFILCCLMLVVIRVNADRQDRLTKVAQARVQEKEQEARLQELRLIEQGKLPASPPEQQQS